MKPTIQTEPTICRTAQLTKQQIREIRNLVSLCQKHDRSNASYPFEDNDAQHYLLYDSDALCSVLSVLSFGTEAECIAFTHPDKRRRGYFSELLDLAEEDLNDCDILFPVSGNCPDTLAALKAIGAEPESLELQMEANLCSFSGEQDSSKTTALCRLNDTIFADCGWELSFSDTGSNAPIMLGTCMTSPVSASCICLHHVEILPQFRKKGYGSVMISKLLSNLKAAGVQRVILQVSGSNEAAFALYQKQGFCITETLSYYLY